MAGSILEKVYTLIVLLSLANSAFGCNGYKIKVTKLTNCAGEDGIIIPNSDFSVKLNKKCELIPTGCVQFKAYTSAQAKYFLKKDNLVIHEGSADLCSPAEGANRHGKLFLQLLAIPDKCPVKANKLCANGITSDISKFKHILAAAQGKSDMEIKTTHDTGKSCIHLEMEIFK